MKNLVFILSLIFLISCGNQKRLMNERSSVSKTSETLITETIRDTTLAIQAETSSLVLEIRVDSLGTVHIEEDSSYSSEHMNKPAAKIIDNKLHIDCESRARELFLQWKEKHSVTKDIEVRETVIEVPVERELTFMQELMIWLGRIFSLVLMALIVVIIIKIKK